MNNHKRRSVFWVFLGLAGVMTLLLVVATLVFVPLAAAGVKNPWDFSSWMTMLSARSGYILLSVVNLLLFIAVCICGALLYSKRFKNTPRALVIIAAICFMSAFLLHGMVYGIDLFIPSTYSLFSPDHRTLMLIGFMQGSPFDTTPWASLVSAFIHAFAPQVVLGLVVGSIAVRRVVAQNRLAGDVVDAVI